MKPQLARVYRFWHRHALWNCVHSSPGHSAHVCVLQESISASAGAASSAAEAASASLPEPVRDALAASKGPVSRAVSQVSSPPGRTQVWDVYWTRAAPQSPGRGSHTTCCLAPVEEQSPKQ